MQSTNKNLLLNGDFSVCQRLEPKGSLVESNIISGSNSTSSDRWNNGDFWYETYWKYNISSFTGRCLVDKGFHSEITSL